MTDINPDQPDAPVQVPASPVGQQAATGSRDFLLLLAALPALVAVLGKRDVTSIVNWLGSEPGIAFVGLLIALLTPLWRQWVARRKHANELKMAKRLPDHIAVVKGKTA